MKSPSRRLFGVAGLSWLGLLAGGMGPRPAPAAEPSAAEVSVKSYTLKMQGFKETATVNATPEELYQFFSRPNNLTIRDVRIRKPIPALGREGAGAGDLIPFWYTKVIVIPGRFLSLKLASNQICIIRDFTHRNYLQYNLAPGPDGTQVTFHWVGEVTDTWWYRDFKFLAPPEYWHKSEDLLVANIQAHFDPSLKAKKLIKPGLRGDAYESVLQVHEASVWIQASPGRVNRYLDHPASPYLQLGRSEADCLAQALPADRFRFCRSTAENLGQPVLINNFGIAHVQGRKYVRRHYQDALGLVGFLEMTLTPEKRGTRLVMKWVWDMPDPMAANSMDQTLFLTSIPQRLQETAAQIKKGAEAAP